MRRMSVAGRERASDRMRKRKSVCKEQTEVVPPRQLIGGLSRLLSTEEVTVCGVVRVWCV